MRKIIKALFFVSLRLLGYASPAQATRLAVWGYAHLGMRFEGTPNYISSRAWFDGSDYSRISLGEGCTISTQVSFLTHDWSIHTIAKPLGITTSEPLGRHGTITIKPYAFIGRGSIIMPGVVVGTGALVGAGSVVRGTVADHAIVMGNPAQVVGTTQEYLARHGVL